MIPLAQPRNSTVSSSERKRERGSARGGIAFLESQILDESGPQAQRGETHALAMRAIHLDEHGLSMGAAQAGDALRVLIQEVQGCPSCATLVG